MVIWADCHSYHWLQVLTDHEISQYCIEFSSMLVVYGAKRASIFTNVHMWFIQAQDKVHTKKISESLQRIPCFKKRHVCVELSQGSLTNHTQMQGSSQTTRCLQIKLYLFMHHKYMCKSCRVYVWTTCICEYWDCFTPVVLRSDQNG